MELHAEQSAFGVLEGSRRRVRGHRGHHGTGGGTHHGVAVAHPDLLGSGEPGGDDLAGLRHLEFHPAVLGEPAAVDLASELVGEELCPVADSEDRHAEREDLRIETRGAGGVHRLRSATEDQPGGAAPEHALGRNVVRHDLAVHAGLANPPGDELGILGAEVHHEHAALLGGACYCARHSPMPTPCWCCRAFPSLAIEGATITSAFWSSLSVA